MAKTEPTSKPIFEELLLSRRRSMGAGNRKRSKKRKFVSWLYPSATERAYSKDITALMKGLFDPVLLEISENLQGWIDDYNFFQGKFDAEGKEDQFFDKFRIFARSLRLKVSDIFEGEESTMLNRIRDFAFSLSGRNRAQWRKQKKTVLGTDFDESEPWEGELLSAWGQANFDLIQSLSNEYIKKLNLIVSDGVTKGETWDEIMIDLKKMHPNMTQARAKLLARDQAGKLNGLITQRRQEEVGVETYYWSTAGDERVRGNPAGPWKNAVPSHFVMNGKLCQWGDRTVFSEDGGKTWKKRFGKMPIAHPGEEIQCRCTAIPNFSPQVEEADEKIVA